MFYGIQRGCQGFKRFKRFERFKRFVDSLPKRRRRFSFRSGMYCPSPFGEGYKGEVYCPSPFGEGYKGEVYCPSPFGEGYKGEVGEANSSPATLPTVPAV
jgi:hypothetical protein